jgi:hypothetical protein
VPRAAEICKRWRFLVIRDPKIKEIVGAYYKRAWDEQKPRSGEAGVSRKDDPGVWRNGIVL